MIYNISSNQFAFLVSGIPEYVCSSNGKCVEIDVCECFTSNVIESCGKDKINTEKTLNKNVKDWQSIQKILSFSEYLSIQSILY